MTKKIKPLKDLFKHQFKIGAAINPEILAHDEELILTHFNSVTVENDMKFGEIHPEENRYAFERADIIADFVRENHLTMRGHTFVWHNQTSDWLFKDQSGKNVDEATLLDRLEQHMRIMNQRYGDIIYVWDVVNEAIEDKKGSYLRESLWKEILGDNYIEKIFRLAEKVNPSVDLFYNDYNETKPEKRDKIYKLVKNLKDNGVKIDGIGMQAHWSMDKPSIDEIKEALDMYASLDVKIHITEMDVRLCNEGEKPKFATEPEPEMLKKQALRYQAFFKLFQQYEAIESVTLWGVSDYYSWLDDFIGKGNKTWPLLFNEEGRPKEAYWYIVDSFSE